MDMYADYEFQQLGRNAPFGNNGQFVNPIFERPMSAQARLGQYENGMIPSPYGRTNFRAGHDKQRSNSGQLLRDKNSRSPRPSSPQPDKNREPRSALLEEFRNSKTKNFELSVIFSH
jgi:hypothetical protein